MTKPKVNRRAQLEEKLKSNAIFVIQKICKAVREGRYSDAMTYLTPIAEHLVLQKQQGKEILGRNSSGKSILETRFLVDEKGGGPFSELGKQTQEAITTAFQSLPNLHRDIGPLATLLTNNLLAEAILRPCDGIKSFLYIAAKDYLHCASLTAEKHLGHSSKLKVAGNSL